MNRQIHLKAKVEQIKQTLRREGRTSYRLPDHSHESRELARLLTREDIYSEFPNIRKPLTRPLNKKRNASGAGKP